MNGTRRTDAEMERLILDTARGDARIRAVILNGSRANPNAPADLFRDFDIVCLVDPVESFVADPSWIERFGPMMIVQTPDAMGEPPRPAPGRFTWLMQCADGHRIDLTLMTLEVWRSTPPDSLSVVWLDKDGVVGDPGEPSERDYLPSPPTAKAFHDACNEFWWVAPYVAKGLWRGQIPYAKHHLDGILRNETLKMLTWHFAIRTGGAVAPGYLGKNLPARLEPELWSLYLDTYCDADARRTWGCLRRMCDLFRRVAQSVAAHHGFAYPEREDALVSAHLARVEGMPRDAGATP